MSRVQAGILKESGFAGLGASCLKVLGCFVLEGFSLRFRALGLGV